MEPLNPWWCFAEIMNPWRASRRKHSRGQQNFLYCKALWFMQTRLLLVLNITTYLMRSMKTKWQVVHFYLFCSTSPKVMDLISSIPAHLPHYSACIWEEQIHIMPTAPICLMCRCTVQRKHPDSDKKRFGEASPLFAERCSCKLWVWGR